MKIKTVLFLFAMLFLASCASRSSEIKPPDIQYGQALCDACGMVIDDARFAAAIVLGDGKSMAFDDLGEMLSYVNKRDDLAVAAWYVHDYNSEAWIDALTAVYVKGSMIKTPMGSGVIAFEDASAAQVYIADLGGELLKWEELILSQVQAGHNH